ncbi:MAG: CAP domain-containing protein [Xenococcaceae cyanobacterium]
MAIVFNPSVGWANTNSFNTKLLNNLDEIAQRRRGAEEGKETVIPLKTIWYKNAFDFSVGWAKYTNSFQSHSFKIATSGDLDALEKSIFQKINEYRRSQNLTTLKFDDRLSEQARIHSQAMASGNVPFSHDRFEERTRAIEGAIDYRSIAENVAYNQGFGDPVTQAIDGWLKSPSHRQNIEGNFNLTGIGVAKNSRNEYYFTQIFVLQR